MWQLSQPALSFGHAVTANDIMPHSISSTQVRSPVSSRPQTAGDYTVASSTVQTAAVRPPALAQAIVSCPDQNGASIATPWSIDGPTCRGDRSARPNTYGCQTGQTHVAVTFTRWTRRRAWDSLRGCARDRFLRHHNGERQRTPVQVVSAPCDITAAVDLPKLYSITPQSEGRAGEQAGAAARITGTSVPAYRLRTTISSPVNFRQLVISPPRVLCHDRRPVQSFRITRQ